MLTDVFSGDAFSAITLTGAVNRLPYIPQEISTWLPWNASGVPTRVVIVDEKSGGVDIVPAAPIGSAPAQIGTDPRDAVPLLIPHYPAEVTVMASEVQGVRLFGSDSALETVESKRDEKLGVATRSHSVTLERARAGALNGAILNKDGSTIVDLYATFGVSRSTHDIDFADTDTDIISELIDAKEVAEDKLGSGYLTEGFQLIASAPMFKKYISHPSVKAAWQRWQDGAALRADNRRGFEIVEGVFLRSYSKGKIGNTKFINDLDSFLCPNSDGLYETRFAPADTLDFANTVGLPMYSIPEMLPYNRGVKLLVESNHVSWVARPEAIVRIRQSA